MTDTSTLPPGVAGTTTPTTTPPAPPATQGGAPPAVTNNPNTPPAGPTTTVAPTANPVSTKVQVAAKAAPKLDPQTTVAAAQVSSSPAEAAQNAQIVQIFKTATTLGQQLSQQPLRAQIAMWTRASKPLRDLLDAAGYTPPNAPPTEPPQQRQDNQPQPSRGLFGGLWHGVAHQFDNVRHAGAAAGGIVKKGASKALGAVSDVANVGVSQAEHEIRAGFQLADVNDLAYQQGHESLSQDLHALVSPSQWIDAWHKTANGAASFQPQVVRALSKKLSPFNLTLAKYLASGLDLQTVLTKVPQAQRGAAYATIETDRDFQDAVAQLGDSHLSFGQSVFGGATPAQMAAIGADKHNPGAFALAGDVLGGTALGAAKGSPLLAATGAATGLAAGIAGAATGKTPDELTTVSPFGLKVHPLSGILDGVVQWYASPLVLGASMRSGYNAGRFAMLDGLGNARDVRALYQSDNAVKAAMDRIGSLITSPSVDDSGKQVANVAAVIRAFPTLNPLADDLERAYPAIKAAAEDGNAGHAVSEFFAETQSLLNLARGRAGLFFKSDTMFPHLTVPGRAQLAVRGSLDDMLHGASGLNLAKLSPRQWFRTVFGNDTETAAVDAQRGAGPFARFARRATTLGPVKDYIDLTDTDRASVFERYAKMFLPDERAGQLTNAFMAIPITDQGRQIKAIQGLQEELFAAAGLDKSEAGQAYLADWQRRRELEGQGEHYSFGNNAFYRNSHADEEIGREHALWPSQLSSAVMMPDFRELYSLSKKSWAMEQLTSKMTPEALDRFMERVWKPTLLLRPGFGIRVAGEELFGHILRNGLRDTVASRLAASAEHITSPAQRDLQLSKRLWGALTSHIPGVAKATIKTPEDLQAQVYGWRAMNFLRRAGVHFVPDQVMDAARWWAANGRYEGPLSESIDAMTQHSGGIVDDETGWNDAIKRWGGGEPVRMRPVGSMTSYGGNEEEAFPAYHYALSGFTDDVGPGKAIAGAFDQGHQAMIDAAKSWMNDPKNAKLVSRFVVSHQVKDGREVATGEASVEEAQHTWAEALVDHVLHYTVDQDGRPITFTHYVDGDPMRDYHFDTDAPLTRVIDFLAEGKVPDTAELETISRSQLPNEIVARKLMPDPETGWQKIVNVGMREMVGRPLNWLSRQPVFLHNFSKSFAEAKTLVKSLGINDEEDKLAGDIASERAWRETMPYIHNPRVRSQMSVITRNLAPFWFAQEQFFKRWARTFATYPEAFRKAQLLMNGLRSVGFIQKDSYGQDSFTYPASGFVSEFLARAIPGASVMVPNAFTSEISQLNPSFGSNGLSILPGVGPAVSIPARWADSLIPALDPYLSKMLGPQAPAPDHSQSLPVQLLSALVNDTAPTIVNRLIQVGESTNPKDPFYSSMKASAAIAAAQYLEANGHGPPSSQNPAEIDAWQQRLANWTQTMMAFRAIFGFASPATPAFKIGNTTLGKELTALTQTMPYDQAVSAFLKVHPNATAYTVAASTTAQVGESGAYIPATQPALDFIDAHKGFFDNYKAAAPWLMPLSTGKGAFSDQAYQNELSMAMRSRRDFGSWWQDVRYAEASNIYFPLETKVKAAEAADPGAKNQIQHDWDTWVTGFKQRNPIFASMIDEPTASNRRSLVVQEMEQALNDAALPKTAQAEHTALLMAGFQKVQDFYQQTQGDTSYNAQHTENKKAFLAWGDEVAKTYPDVAPFWTGVLSKEVPG